MKKLNRAIVRDSLRDFYLSPASFWLRSEPQSAGGLTPISTRIAYHSADTRKAVADAYREGAADFARFLQEQFQEEKNLHLSKDGEVQNLYHFHFSHGGLPTKKVKWMTPAGAELYARQYGYRLELIRTTHKPV